MLLLRARPLPSPPLLLLAALALPACGDDGSASATSGDELGPFPPTGTDGTTDTVDGTASAATEADSTGGPCPAPQVCGDACCSPSETCTDGQCVLDCGIDPPCGDVCCGASEVCYVGQCIVPSGPCSAAVCATSVTSDCQEGEICDAQLGQCVPNLADPSCVFEPEIGVFDPVPRFTWGVRAERSCDLGCQKEEVCNAMTNLCEPTWPHVAISDDDFPAHHQCVMSPMVADLDGDCTPEIVFNTYNASNYTTGGILRAISGNDGSRVWTLAEPRTDPGSHPAIGDITGDGTPEVIVPTDGTTLVAVNADGTVLWESQSYSGAGKSGSPSLANFDNAGLPEIAFGRNVFDADGILRWNAASGPTGINGNNVGPLSCVADLTGDGRPELILGGTAYTFTGTVGVDFAGQLLWTGEQPDGYCGVADFDLDGQPEVVNVRAGNIYLYDGLTGITLGVLPIPGGGAGGPPNIADFDGDGFPDVGTAGADIYVVGQWSLAGGMTQLWQADTKDGSSQRTGSSVFDFDGDGRSEVIYADEWYLRIYPGTEPDCAVGGPLCDGVMTDDEILFIDINSSRTRSEYPIIADVDGDFKAEIVVSTNNESAQGAIGDAGVEVFEDRLDNWVGTRPIWNQHTYHVTNVQTDGSIPVVEPPNWETFNSYRRNGQGGLEQLCAPDLVAADLTIPTLACPELHISVKVLNQGCLGVGPGVDVSFYDGAALLLTTQTQGPIPAGGSETIEVVIPDPGGAPFEIRVVVDDAGNGTGGFNECREENNEAGPLEVCQPIG